MDLKSSGTPQKSGDPRNNEFAKIVVADGDQYVVMKDWMENGMPGISIQFTETAGGGGTRMIRVWITGGHLDTTFDQIDEDKCRRMRMQALADIVSDNKQRGGTNEYKTIGMHRLDDYGFASD